VAAEPELVLQVDEVFASYARAPVLRGLSLEVRPGEITALLGPNGAGKTTTLRVVCGVLKPRRGRVLLNGHEITRCRPEDLVRQGLVMVPEGARVFGPLSVMDNLLLGAYPVRRLERPRSRQECLEHVLALFPALERCAKRSAGSLSGGEQQMVAIGRALMSQPSLLLLDEPSLGLAPVLIRDLMLRILDMRGDDLAVLLVEQNARAALRVADRAYVLGEGRVKFSGAASLVDDPEAIKEAYLGATQCEDPSVTG
jgi:branched-chain amino acid transport system ATP-binding protein